MIIKKLTKQQLQADKQKLTTHWEQWTEYRIWQSYQALKPSL